MLKTCVIVRVEVLHDEHIDAGGSSECWIELNEKEISRHPQKEISRHPPQLAKYQQ
ncbi:hypothetical protein [Agarivorans sp. QJM3NY_33]|uniref:hypothetical protein n=1 Tax=Agarivorans sp. QJM3NY_33 TaxID=3421432 RepID=UPI003D7D7284